jgi:hypothetical protein
MVKTYECVVHAVPRHVVAVRDARTRLALKDSPFAHHARIAQVAFEAGRRIAPGVRSSGARHIDIVAVGDDGAWGADVSHRGRVIHKVVAIVAQEGAAGLGVLCRCACHIPVLAVCNLRAPEASISHRGRVVHKVVAIIAVEADAGLAV